MSDFNPGPGWREVDYAPMDGEEEYLVHTPVDDTKVTYWARAILDAPPVDVTPPQDIDPDALKDLILWAMHAGLRYDTSDVWVERFLALVRPVEGYMLTPEEAALAADALRAAFAGTSPQFHEADVLASRLEAAP